MMEQKDDLDLQKKDLAPQKLAKNIFGLQLSQLLTKVVWNPFPNSAFVGGLGPTTLRKNDIKHGTCKSA